MIEYLLYIILLELNSISPELVVFDGYYHVSGGKVYAYVNGKVKYLGEFGEWGGFEIIKRPEWARKQDMYV